MFDFYISFESVISFFDSQYQLGIRSEYKIEILNRAIGKFEIKGTKANPSNLPAKVNTFQGRVGSNDKMTQFWQNYWNDLSIRIPQLHMPKPEAKGPDATYIFLGKSQLPANVVIKHKILDGEVYLEFGRLGKNVDAFYNDHKNLIEEGMDIKKIGKSSVAIIIEVPKIINPYKFFDEIQEDVHQGQDAAKTLLDFYNMKIRNR